jgi:DNA-binding NtrC family response regulator
LRERITDVPILVEHFLKKINNAQGVKKSVSNEALKLLMGYSWPGNVRQLESIIERAYIMCEGNVIDVEHIPEEVNQGSVKNIPEQIDIPDEGIDFETVEKELIKKAFVKAEGKVSVAARLLNMPYDKLWFKIKKMKEKGELF